MIHFYNLNPTEIFSISIVLFYVLYNYVLEHIYPYKISQTCNVLRFMKFRFQWLQFRLKIIFFYFWRNLNLNVTFFFNSIVIPFRIIEIEK